MLFVQFMLRYIYLVFPNLKSAKRRALCVFVCVIMCVCSLATKGSPQCKEAWPVPIYTHTLFILPFVTHSYTSMPAPLYVVILFKGSPSACCAHALLYIRGEVNQQMHTRCATLLKRITFPPLFTAEPENHTPLPQCFHWVRNVMPLGVCTNCSHKNPIPQWWEVFWPGSGMETVSYQFPLISSAS